ncbi:MAG: S8 family serine peptidase [Acidimicrobiia bacterium]
MKRLTVLVGLIALFAAAAAPAGAQERPVIDPGTLADSIEDLRLDQPLTTSNARGKLDRELRGAQGRVTVSIRLTEPAAATAAGQGSDSQRGQLRRVEAQQQNFLRKLARADASAVVVASTQRALNAVFAEVEAASLNALAAEPEVFSIKRVVNYEMSLSETVPYIGATAVHNDLGFDGSGIVVAVVDSGVDYTHADLGGPGTVDAYFQAYGENNFSGKNRSINDRYLGQLLFPTAKVIGGFDFVGERWPEGNLRPDPDPIDFDGHGTHVSDIVAGVHGVAPGAVIFAIKACSSISTSCSGVALIQAMDLAVDPDRDGDTADHVDIINMSLGALYGQAFDDDLSQAVENATTAGVLTVAASGNGSDKPYVTDTPAATQSAFSVAQTHVPSAGLQLITVPGVGDIRTAFLPWSAPVTETISGELIYGDGSGGNLNGCAAFAAGSLAGKFVLVDRGACDFSLKISNIALGGGAVGIIGLIAPGAPFEGGLGACPSDACNDIPGFMISQADSTAIKALVPTTATIDPANALPLVGQMVGSSSRGPSMVDNFIKPEIGAPGASVSAEVGTGTGTTPFGGTSGATPMVAGSAALLMQAAPSRTPAEVKAVLINTAEIDIDTDPFTGLAPVQRIGGGEVRVDRAARSGAAAWDTATGNGALSFGFVDVTGTSLVLTKTVTVQNYSSSAIDYSITPTFRYPADQALGAVAASAPGSVIVPANGSATFDLTLTVDGSRLGPWTPDSGSNGANPTLMTDMDFDGYVQLDAAGSDNDIHLPWHLLPRKAGDVSAAPGGAVGEFVLTNASTAGPARVEAYTLFGVSEDLAEGPIGGQTPVIDLQFIGIATIPGGCGEEDGSLIQFVVNTHERQTHAVAPASFEFDLDVNGDGAPDFAIFNADFSLATGVFNLSDGRNLVFAQDLATDEATAFFFTDHDTNSANTVLTVCASQIGGDAVLLGQEIGVTALAVDIYYQGEVTDAIEGITWIPGLERFLGLLDGSLLYTSFLPGSIATSGSADLTVLDFGDAGASDQGLLVLNRLGAPEDREAIAILGDGSILP